MGEIQTAIELLLVVLLIATLLHAVRLHRALGGLRQDRETLQDAVAGFDSGTRQAEAGLAGLREMTEQLGGKLGHAAALKDDLEFLSERGESLADRLDALVRAGRALEPALAAPRSMTFPPAASRGMPEADRVRSQAERDLLLALKGRA